MGLMDTLRRISAQYGEGLLTEKYGPDFRQKSALLKAQTENVGAETERSRAATEHERAGTQRERDTLQEAQARRDRIRKLVEAGKLPAEDLDVADYYVRKAEADSRLATEQGARRHTRAQTAYVEGNTLTPEQKAQDFMSSQRLKKSQAGYYDAVGAYNRVRQPGGGAGQVATHHFTPQQIADLQRQATATVRSKQPGRNILGAVGHALTGKAMQMTRDLFPSGGLAEGSPEEQQAIQQEMERLKQQSMVQLRRDPKTGKTFYVGAGGVEFPASPEVVQAFTGGAPEPTAPAPVTGASPEPQDYEPGRQY